MEFNAQRNEFLFIMQYTVQRNVCSDFCTCYGKKKTAIKTHKNIKSMYELDELLLEHEGQAGSCSLNIYM